MDKVSGQATLVGPIGVPMITLELAGDGTLYGIEYGPNGRLYSIDKTTGVGTAIGTGTGIDYTMDVAFDCAGRLWATTMGDLWRIDLATGASTMRSSLTRHRRRVLGHGVDVRSLVPDAGHHLR